MNTRIVVNQYGGPEVLAVQEEALRSPKKGEIRVKAESIGVALADLMRRKGIFSGGPIPPFTPGYDAVGIVDEVGEDIRQFSKGDKVGVFFNGTGAYAAYVYAAADEVFPIPGSVDSAQAVAAILNYLTAYQLLHRLAKVSEGDRVLIHGASGGVGTALLELGKLASLAMFGTASSAKHHIVSQYGAAPIDYRDEDFAAVLAAAVPEGLDAVFDPIGGPNWRRSLQTLKKAGSLVVYGYTSTVLGQAEPDESADEWKKLAELKQKEDGNPIFVYSITQLKKEHPDWFQEDMKAVMSLLEQGKINPLVSHRIPLTEAARAHEMLENSLSAGKIVLTV